MSVIRPATPADIPVILQMIHELAVYEKEPDAVRNTPELLTEVLFSNNPRVYAHMAENEDGQVRGLAMRGEAASMPLSITSSARCKAASTPGVAHSLPLAS